MNPYDFRSVEYRLDGAVRSRLRSFADGARPLTTLFARILTFDPSPQYATFLPDRSRLANYSNVDVTETYYTRVLRELGGDFSIPAGADLRSVDAEIRERIAAAPVIPEDAFHAGTEAVAGYVRQIQARGGRVFFVDFPTSGLITEMEEHACPRARCWDQLAATTGAPHLASSDVPSLRALPVPDGSHIDFRNRRILTLALVELLNLAKHPSDTRRLTGTASAPTGRDRITPLPSKRAREIFGPGGAWRRLYSLANTSARNPAHHRFGETRRDDFRDRQLLFDEAFEDRVEHVVGRQRVAVLLVVAQLGGRRARDDAARILAGETPLR